MKKSFLLLMIISFSCSLRAQLSIDPGYTISIIPGTTFTLQENLINNGTIESAGVLTLNGTAVQNLSGSGTVENITADNNTLLVSDFIINKALVVNTGKIFSIGNYQLTSNGTITGSGLLRGSLDAGLVLNGGGNSIIQLDQSNDAVSNAFKNISVSGGSANISFQNKLYLYESLLPTAGAVVLNDEFILRSNFSGTARVGAVGTSIGYGSNGKFVVERFVPGNRAWRLLTSPITTGTQLKISEAWQDNAPRVTNVNIINSTNNPNPGYGTHVTFGYPATNGYDQGINGNPSIRYLMNTGWNGVPTATDNGSVLNSGYINDQPGYMLFVRGDRSTLLWQATGAATTPTVLRPKGKINTGPYNHPLAGGYNNGIGSVFKVIGNPYPSPINFHSTVTQPVNVANGFADAFYVWDPNITGTNGVGGFVGMSYNAAASLLAGKPIYDKSVASSSVDNSGDIQSGAAVVIDYTGAATALRIDETNKSTGSNNSFFRPAKQIRTALLAENNDNSTSVNDEVLISFSEANAGGSGLKKLDNFAENLAVCEGVDVLCIQNRKPLTITDTIFYQLTKLKVKKYLLQVALAPFSTPEGAAVFLEDIFLKEKLSLNINDTNLYRFAVTPDAATAAKNRFRLTFRQINTFNTFKVELVNSDVLLGWALDSIVLVDHFEIERSTDGIQFNNAGSAATRTYSWVDADTKPGRYFYRIKCVNTQGVISYSAVKDIVIADNRAGMFVYPNPVKEHMTWLRINKAQTGVYSARITDKNGALLQIVNFVSSGGNTIQKIVMSNNVAAGIYQLVVIAPNGAKTSLQVAVLQR